MDWPTFLKAVNDGAYSNLIFGALVLVPVMIYSCGYALAECRRMWLDAGRDDDVEDEDDAEEGTVEERTQMARVGEAEAVTKQAGSLPKGPAASHQA